MEILVAPDPRLLQKSAACSLPDSTLEPLAKEMINIMYKYDGIGLAAPQVGVLKRLIVIDCDYNPEEQKKTQNPIILVNPKIVKREGEIVQTEEGCLSCPGIRATVSRNPHVIVEYYNLDGGKKNIEGDDLLAYCLQHEIDHLDGKTLMQTSDPKKRVELQKKYQEALALGAQPGSVVVE